MIEYSYNVLDDQLASANYVLVNTTEQWLTASYWQVAVDEEAAILYSAAMVDNSMSLHAWTFSTDDNSSSLLFAPHCQRRIYQPLSIREPSTHCC